MTIERFWVHDAVIVTPATVAGRYGDEVDWDNATRRSVKAWVVGRRASDLALASRDEASHRDIDASYWEGYFPADSAIDPQDRVEVHGFLAEVVGHPRPGYTPNMGVNHTEVLLKVVEG